MAKLKVKTCKSAAKRFRVTGRGKIMHRRAMMRHLLTGKSASRKRRLRCATVLHRSDRKRISRLIPYA